MNKTDSYKRKMYWQKHGVCALFSFKESNEADNYERIM